MTEFHVRFPDIDVNTELLDLIKNLKNVKPLKPEIKIEDVQIACQIGSGKFSDVFLAIVGPDCYALKVFKPYYHHRVEEERNTLLLLTKYAVPNIPRLISTFSVAESRRDAFLMDLMYEHYDINKIRELSIDVKIAIIYKILFSLKRANEAGIIHGNICPSNILIDSSLDQFKSDSENYDLKRLVNLLIVGWNISIRSQDSTMFQRISFNKSVSIQYTIDHKDIKIFGGNYFFKAPELLVRKKTFSSKVDVWSVGCLFAHFLLDDDNPLWDNEKTTSLPQNLDVLRKIAVKVGPEDILKTCKEFISAEHISLFSAISQPHDPFKNIYDKIELSINDIIQSKISKVINLKITDTDQKKDITNSIQDLEFKAETNSFWTNIYKKIQNKDEVPIDMDKLISNLDSSKNSLYYNLKSLMQQCICVSEYTRYNTSNALEQITRIRDILIDFQNSLKNLIDVISKDL